MTPNLYETRYTDANGIAHTITTPRAESHKDHVEMVLAMMNQFLPTLEERDRVRAELKKERDKGGSHDR